MKTEKCSKHIRDTMFLIRSIQAGIEFLDTTNIRYFDEYAKATVGKYVVRLSERDTSGGWLFETGMSNNFFHKVPHDVSTAGGTFEEANSTRYFPDHQYIYYYFDSPYFTIYRNSGDIGSTSKDNIISLPMSAIVSDETLFQYSTMLTHNEYEAYVIACTMHKERFDNVTCTFDSLKRMYTEMSNLVNYYMNEVGE